VKSTQHPGKFARQGACRRKWKAGGHHKNCGSPSPFPFSPPPISPISQQVAELSLSAALQNFPERNELQEFDRRKIKKMPTAGGRIK